jgi:hypothetical protein
MKWGLSHVSVKPRTEGDIKERKVSKSFNLFAMDLTLARQQRRVTGGERGDNGNWDIDLAVKGEDTFVEEEGDKGDRTDRGVEIVKPLENPIHCPSKWEKWRFEEEDDQWRGGCEEDDRRPSSLDLDG